MSRMLKTKHNGQRGSVTVEAAIAFTGFLFVIFTILGVINVCRVQMLVSSALDTAAKEMAQYSYFYKMSGLQKFSEDLSATADVGKDKVNEVVGTVDDLIGTVVSAKDGTVEDVTNLANATSQGTVTYQDLETTINNVKQNGSDVMSGITAVESKFSDVAANPMSYVRSLVAIAGETGLDFAKSRVLAVPLGRMFFQKHFGDTAEEASETLERLGVVDGLEGMNFNMSTIFSSDHPEDVRLVVYYKVKMVNFLSSEDFTLSFCKQATVRGWLAGDNPIVVVKKSATSGTGEGGEKGEENPDNQDPTTENPEDSTEPTGETVPVETEETTEPTIDYENSYWYMDNTEGDQYHAFKEELFGTDRYLLTHENKSGMYLEGYNDYGHAYGMDTAVDAESLGDIGYSAQIQLLEDIKKQEQLYVETNGEQGIEPGTINGATMIVYVPENISNEELIKMRSVAKQNEQLYLEIAHDKFGSDEAFPVNVIFIPAGGDYDYGSGG